MSSPSPSSLRSPARPGSPVRDRTVARGVRAGVACGGLSLVLLGLVAAGWAPLLRLDRAVAEALHRRAVADPGLVHANRIMTDWVWDPWTVRALLAVAVVVLWWKGARTTAGWVAATALLASAVQQGVKAAVGRERPHWPDPVDLAHYAAFPSGHVMTLVVGSGVLLWLVHRAGARPAVRRGALALAGVSVVGVGFTRVFLGVHWLSDVVGGVLMGSCTVAFAVAARAAARARTGS
ncbi:phosphatase PAP2 family protein [uncultured Streptomyces sp.]|uniref:phosphatase PAP2 family protein n=1 Tax=uncultured Streptomyces sp. TaxID=174707 RepID=UPI00261155D8|nr:phosphatase PAP2 family protein [uncultured Streptomyces sp.]